MCILASGWTFITANITFSLYKQLQCLQEEKKIIMTLGQWSSVLDLDLRTRKEVRNPLQLITSAHDFPFLGSLGERSCCGFLALMKPHME